MKKLKFKQVDSAPNFSHLEEEVLKRWQKEKIFEKSVQNRKNGQKFIFFEGPPTANGKPGTHHVEARAFKDLFPRYKTMRGYYCERKGGWDCHGLPVEIEVEKKLGLSGKPDIEKFGVEAFNKLCRDSVYTYVDDWTKITDRIGYWVDMTHPYETMDNSYIETGWWLLKNFWQKGLLYEDYKVVPYCSRCGTSLSTHELALGYKDNTKDTSVYVKFSLKDHADTFFLAWTTTPWTLPGNVGLAVDPKAKYVAIETAQGEKLILAESRYETLGIAGKVVKTYLGQDLVGWNYEPLYKYINYEKKAHYVVPADFVSMEEGTGIVHTAVMYGEDDFELGKKFDLPKKHAVNERGEFVSEVKPWAGMFVKKADPLIIDDLEKRGLLFKKEDIVHTYPFCWRCGTPLLYYALTSWYLRTTQVKDRLIENNDTTNWIPNHIKNGRMGEWLRNNKDWALSRSRYWGSPLPVWICDKCNHRIVVGSVSELSKLSGQDQSELDLHRPYVDNVTIKCEKCGAGTMKRVPFVLDCWFDSGSMPYAQDHYPFTKVSKNLTNFSADYICEAVDQTRGWFYTLQAIAALMGTETAYKNVICLGHVLDEKGLKMSKSKGNIVDPWSVLNEAGADAMRWYFYSVITPGESFNFSINLVKEINRRLLLILWNCYKFFVANVELDAWSPKTISASSSNVLDVWILTRLNNLVEQSTTLLDEFKTYEVTQLIEKFVNEFSTWYIRRSRDRVGPTAEEQHDKNDFYVTTYNVLLTLCKIMAPFTPFIADEIYTNLTGGKSVHLADWPEVAVSSNQLTNSNLLEEMNKVRKICEAGNAKRKELGIKVRQPLSKLIVRTTEFVAKDELIHLIKDELNVKSIVFDKIEGDLVVEYDTTLTPELEAEGKARGIVRDIQEARKLSGTNLDEKVEVRLPDWPSEFEEYIKNQTLASKLVRGEELKVIRGN